MKKQPYFKEKVQEIVEDQKEIDEAKKKDAKDMENVDFAVLDKGKEIHRSKNLKQAQSIARNINGRIWWLIEGAFVNEIKL